MPASRQISLVEVEAMPNRSRHLLAASSISRRRSAMYLLSLFGISLLSDSRERAQRDVKILRRPVCGVRDEVDFRRQRSDPAHKGRFANT